MPDFLKGVYQLTEREAESVNHVRDVLDVLEVRAGIFDPQLIYPGIGGDFGSLVHTFSAVGIDLHKLAYVKQSKLAFPRHTWQVGYTLNPTQHFNEMLAAFNGKLINREEVGNASILNLEVPNYPLKQLVYIGEEVVDGSMAGVARWLDPSREQVLFLRAGEALGYRIFSDIEFIDNFVPHAIILDSYGYYAKDKIVNAWFEENYYFQEVKAPTNWGIQNQPTRVYWHKDLNIN